MTASSTPMAGSDVGHISEAEARLLEAFGPLEMARLIDGFLDDFTWIEAFATVRSEDDSKVFARVNRGALRNIAKRANAAITKATANPIDTLPLGEGHE